MGLQRLSRRAVKKRQAQPVTIQFQRATPRRRACCGSLLASVSPLWTARTKILQPPLGSFGGLQPMEEMVLWLSRRVRLSSAESVALGLEMSETVKKMSSRTLRAVSIALLVAMLPQLLPRGISLYYCLIDHKIIAHRPGACSCPAGLDQEAAVAPSPPCCGACGDRSANDHTRRADSAESTGCDCCVHLVSPDHAPAVVEADASSTPDGLALISGSTPVVKARRLDSTSRHAPRAPPPPRLIPTPLRI